VVTRALVVVDELNFQILQKLPMQQIDVDRETKQAEWARPDWREQTTR
jgi:hypothetical protein